MRFKKEEFEKALRIAKEAYDTLERANSLLGDIEDHLVKAGVPLTDAPIQELTVISETINKAQSMLHRVGDMIKHYIAMLERKYEEAERLARRIFKPHEYTIRRWI